MAKKIETHYVSDLSGEVIKDKDYEVTRFAINGKGYEIDLTKKERDEFLGMVSKYVEVATAASATVVGRKSVSVGPDAKTMRAWAESQGLTVPARGRLPKEVTEAYENAH